MHIRIALVDISYVVYLSNSEQNNHNTHLFSKISHFLRMVLSEGLGNHIFKLEQINITGGRYDRGMMYTAESTSYGKLGMDTTSIKRTQFVTQTKRFPLIRYSASNGVRGRTCDTSLVSKSDPHDPSKWGDDRP